ncbi:MAG: helix-turn-helix domain-containing protein [Thermoanaerobaculia bacterium]|nr:helix-turn-helix domain-containing protein [Thermoanaerobaculia bacterium]
MRYAARKPLPPLFYTADRVAEMLSLSIRTIRRRLADGTLPHTRLGTRVLIPREAIAELLRDAAPAEVAHRRSLEGAK